jgi:hypothetical protein
MAYKSKFKGKEIDDRLDLVSELSEEVKEKQDSIDDLDSIRNNAKKGASAVQYEQGTRKFKSILINGFSGCESGAVYALPQELTGYEDDIIATKSTLKLINGQSVFKEEGESENITVEGVTEDYVDNAIRTAITEALTTEV